MGVVRLNRDKVISNDCHIVSVHGKLLHSFRTSIDESKSVSLAGSESKGRNSSIALARSFVARCDVGAVEVILSLDKVVV